MLWRLRCALQIAEQSLRVGRPFSTYHGFRYVSIEGLPHSYTPDNATLTSHFVHSDTKVVGDIQFKNESMEILNKIQTAILYTQRSNFHSIPTDCCQREKRGWMGASSPHPRVSQLFGSCCSVLHSSYQSAACTQATRNGRQRRRRSIWTRRCFTKTLSVPFRTPKPWAATTSPRQSSTRRLRSVWRPRLLLPRRWMHLLAAL